MSYPSKLWDVAQLEERQVLALEAKGSNPFVPFSSKSAENVFMAKAKKEICPQCDGEGEVIHREGFFKLASDCHECEGTGYKKKRSANQELKDKLLE